MILEFKIELHCPFNCQILLTMKITRRSPLTGILNEMDLDVTHEQMNRFNLPRDQREPIQDIFPNLSDSEREFLLTGYTDEDWKAIFGPEED